MIIIPASEMKKELIKANELNGRKKLYIMDSLKSTTMVKNMIERQIFCLIHNTIPASVLLGKNSCLLNINPSNYNIAPWIIDCHPDLLIQTIVAEISARLNPYGYTAKCLLDKSAIEVTW